MKRGGSGKREEGEGRGRDEMPPPASKRRRAPFHHPLLSRSELARSPSFVSHGLPPAAEAVMVSYFVEFIQVAGGLLDLSSVCVAAAATYFHRFFRAESMFRFNPFFVVRACLFVAGKSGDELRNAHDVINVTYAVQWPGAEPLMLHDRRQNMAKWMQHTLNLENVLMRVLGFSLQCQHPHHFVLHFVRHLRGTDELASAAWAVTNDSLRTTLCLRHLPSVVAAGAIYLAAELLSGEDADGLYGEWWTDFGATCDEVEDVCLTLADYYESVDERRWGAMPTCLEGGGGGGGGKEEEDEKPPNRPGGHVELASRLLDMLKGPNDRDAAELLLRLRADSKSSE